MNSVGEKENNGLTLDDLKVGQVFLSGTHELDEAQIVAFASSFDPQPFHTDPIAAENTFFKGLAASGWHTAAITMKLLVSSANIFGGLIGAGAEVTWPRPTRAKDVLQVETEIIEIKESRSRPDRGIVTIRSTTRNQERETLQIMISRLVVPKRK
ncbi:MAG: MaoC family dehydratase [Candidatus Melainabacteria bacterium]|nr:MaoC family dehydratase [Candidatus Melainabacteria bacterium]